MAQISAARFKMLLKVFPEKWKLLWHDTEACCFVMSSAKSAFAVGAMFSCLKSFGHVGNLPDTSMLPLPAVIGLPVGGVPKHPTIS